MPPGNHAPCQQTSGFLILLNISPLTQAIELVLMNYVLQDEKNSLLDE